MARRRGRGMSDAGFIALIVVVFLGSIAWLGKTLKISRFTGYLTVALIIIAFFVAKGVLSGILLFIVIPVIFWIDYFIRNGMTLKTLLLGVAFSAWIINYIISEVNK